MRTQLLCGLVVCSIAGTALAQEEPEKNYIPEDLAIAIGTGWFFPTGNIFAPNLVTTRIRTGVIEIEPALVVRAGSGSTESKNSSGTPEATKSEDSNNNLMVMATAYIGLLSKKNVELQAIGGLSFSRQGSSTDPDGDDNKTETSTLGFGVNYGLAIQWWLSERISLTARAANALVNVSTTETKADVAGPSPGTATKQTTTTSSSSFGLVWSPQVAAAVNLWF